MNVRTATDLLMYSTHKLFGSGLIAFIGEEEILINK